jgi:transposase
MKALPILDDKAAGIDVGSEQLHVSIAGDLPRVFGTMTRDINSLVHWLKDQGVRSVAMEATGVYWMCLYAALDAARIGVLVVNGRHVRNVPGRKTDMADCQWIATLHAHGLLSSGFVPSAQIRLLQDYMRLREDHTSMAASHVQHMQKALERMNVKFHDVISDVTGASGMRVIRAIVAGQRDPKALLELCDVQIRKSKAAKVIESLRATWQPEHVFALRHALDGWDFYQRQIAECDAAIEQVLQDIAGPPDTEGKAGPRKPGGTNTPRITGLHKTLVAMCGGIDPTRVPGIADHSLLRLISEAGVELKRWRTEGHFTSWTGLAPASAQSGKRNKSKKRQLNRVGRIFCDIARSVTKTKDSAFGGFYRRLKARRGGLVALKALARKLAAMYWRIMVHGTEYVEEGLQRYQERAQLSEQRVLAKLADKYGLQVIRPGGSVMPVANC